MSILIDKNTKVLIQGIAGREGSRACREMLAYGTKVAAGTTPGKGGTEVEGVPVYDTVAEAKAKHPEIGASLISIPAPAVLDAGLEAIEAGIPVIDILTEHVTVGDCAKLYASAKKKGVRIIGPSSVGIISPGKAKIGSIGSGGVHLIFKPGPIGVISKSGGMTAEIAVVLSRTGLGQSTVVGIGGDQIIGSDFVDILELFEKDKETKASVIFGEIGGTYEERVAEYVSAKKIKKPVIAVVAGKFTENLPAGTALGHAGAIVSRGRGSYTSKMNAFKKAGVPVARTLEEIPVLLKKVL